MQLVSAISVQFDMVLLVQHRLQHIVERKREYTDILNKCGKWPVKHLYICTVLSNSLRL